MYKWTRKSFDKKQRKNQKNKINTNIKTQLKYFYVKILIFFKFVHIFFKYFDGSNYLNHIYLNTRLNFN